MTLVQQECEPCRGNGYIRSEHGVPGPCIACSGTGRRFVPQGYDQRDLEEVRELIDAMAVRMSV